MKFLVVDDIASVRMIICRQLNKLGYQRVEEADGGAQALSMLSQGYYNFLITDLNMPDVSGLDLLKAVRQDPQRCDLPILVVTGDEDEQVLAQIMEAGANAYIVKPLTLESLRQKIDHVMDITGYENPDGD